MKKALTCFVFLVLSQNLWAQDEASCVIYGMPMAIVKADLADAVYSLDDMGKHLVEACL